MTSTKNKKCQCASADKMADALKALGHPVRLRMVQELKSLESCCCADMCECFPQSQSTISQHLSVLKDAGIVSFEKHGNKSCFSLNHDVLEEIQTAMAELFNNQSLGKQND
jgi:DNA-binding transcriptional ArsR family regulator